MLQHNLKWYKHFKDNKLIAENELEILYEIKESSNEDWHESNILMVRIRDTENFLRKNGRIK